MAAGVTRGRLLVVSCALVCALSACGGDAAAPEAGGPTVATAALPTAEVPSVSSDPAPTAAVAVPSGDLVPADLPALDGPVRSYVWAGDRHPTREDFDSLAAALGVTGDVSDGPPEFGGGWSLDGDNLTLAMDGGVEGAWSFSGPPAFAWPSEEEPWPTIETGEPVTMAPPAVGTEPSAPLPDSYPSNDEAQVLAREIVTSLGLDPDAFEWRVGPASFATNVEAWWIVDGTVAPVKLDFGFGPDGMVVFASGQLVGPQAGPEVERVGTNAVEEGLQAEIERTRATPPEGQVLIGGVVVPGAPDATVVLAEPGEPAVTTASNSPASPSPATTAPVPTIAPEMVGRIVEVEPSWQVVRNESETRLLPAYTFIEATGMRYTVSAAP